MPPPVSEWPGQPAPPVAIGGPAPLPGGRVPAGWGARAGAAALDLLVRLAIAAACAGVGALLYLDGTEAGELGLVVGALVGLVLGGLVYAPLLMARRDGQTLGHSAAGIRVVRADGGRITGGHAFVREVLAKGVLIEGLGSLLFYVPTLLNYLWPLWDDRNEALHDKLCSTLVVRA